MAYDLPTPAKISATNFRLQRLIARNPVRDGGHQTAEMGEPLWMAEIETTPLSAAQAGEYAAFLLKLRGGARTAYIYDASRQRPIAYQSEDDLDGWDWSSTSVTMDSTSTDAEDIASATLHPWGAPRVIGYDRAAGTINVDSLAVGAELSPGDYAAWDDGATRRLAMVVEAGEADAGGLATLTIEPAPPADDANLPAVLTLYRAAAEMIVIDSQMPFSATGKHQTTMSAVQILRRFA